MFITKTSNFEPGFELSLLVSFLITNLLKEIRKLAVSCDTLNKNHIFQCRICQLKTLNFGRNLTHRTFLQKVTTPPMGALPKPIGKYFFDQNVILNFTWQTFKLRLAGFFLFNKKSFYVTKKCSFHGKCNTSNIFPRNSLKCGLVSLKSY